MAWVRGRRRTSACSTAVGGEVASAPAVLHFQVARWARCTAFAEGEKTPPCRVWDAVEGVVEDVVHRDDAAAGGGGGACRAT